MQIRLAAPLQYDSVVDGFGVRTVIWTQGCSHNCPFCHNPSTHSFDGGALFEVDDIKEELSKLTYQDGITLSGGDPLFQIEAVTEICKYAKKINLNVWCYTGFTYEKIREMSKIKPIYQEFLNNVDVLVDGKFENAKKDLNLLFRGSSNQRLIDVQETLKNNKVILVQENDKIIDNFQSREKMYI